MKSQYSGTIKVNQGGNPIELYLHQKEAIQALDRAIIKSKIEKFAGMLVLPTGGGKTLTAIQWVLRNIINENKKVLWIAHRHELLEQALSALKMNSFSNLVTKRKNFNYRIVSGKHDRPANIRKYDDFIIAGKDSLNRGLKHLVKNWLSSNDDIFLVIDEAHHATAKTYREIIDVLNQKAKRVKILGLTATPYRTAKKEKGLLKKIFTNDIVYGVDLSTLISRGILSEPIFKELKTYIDMPTKLTEQDMKNIEEFDSLPIEIATHIAQNKIRNKRIVQEYIDNKGEYGKMLVFAINKIHAIELNKLFRDRGIASDYVISTDQDFVGGSNLSTEANKEIIRKFRNNEIDVLINVNILTEGTDIPDVQTVFLTRPTTSEILMTQMTGRALRGKKAGGTEKAFIVNFVDSWKNKIAWANPEKLYVGEGIWNESFNGNVRTMARLVSLKKVEEFVKMADDSVDTTELESVDFIKTIPVGFYSFSLSIPLEHGGNSKKNCEVLVYDDTQKAFQSFIKRLPLWFEEIELNDTKFLEDEYLDPLAFCVLDKYFGDLEMLPSDIMDEIKNIIKYFALNRVEPPFFVFEERNKFDISLVAKHIYDNELGGKRKKKYIDELWDEEESFFKVYFGYNKLYFRKCIDNEILKLEEPEIYSA